MNETTHETPETPDYGPSTLSIDELLHLSLRIPEYQRPYTWERKNMQQLIEDVQLFMHQGYEEYRIGTIILYSPGDTPTQRSTNPSDNSADNAVTDDAVAKNAVPLEVVDGQQRIISCRLIYHALHKILHSTNAAASNAALDDADCTLQLAATTGKSRAITMRHITDNYILATQLLRGMQEGGNTNDDLILFADFFLHHCGVTRFTTDKLGEAFQMFDSQNSRGKALDPTDLLKAFHLRDMAAAGIPDARQQAIVSTWENTPPESVQSLFADYLYPIRLWSRSESVTDHPFTADSIDEFKGIELNCHSSPYSWSKPYIYAYDFVNNIQQETEASTSSGAFTPIQYPFQLDQPVINGAPFFEMVQHYLQLCAHYGVLGRTAQEDDGLLPGEVPHPQAIDQLSFHINDPRISLCKQLFACLLLYYVDRFGEERLYEAVKAIFIYAFLPRLGLQAVRRRSIDKFVQGSDVQRSIPDHVNAFQTLHNAKTPGEFLSSLVFSHKQIVDSIPLHKRSTDTMPWLASLYNSLVPKDASVNEPAQTPSSNPRDIERCTRLVRLLAAENTDVWDIFQALRAIGVITNDKGSWSYRCVLWNGELRKSDVAELLKGIIAPSNPSSESQGGQQ